MKKILIVEDELAYITLLRNTFAKDYKVFTARNGKEGLVTARKERPDLILLDLKMPVMDGLAMLAELRKDQHGKKVQVVLLTNLEPTSQVIQQLVKDQPTYYWVKSDIALDKVITEVRALLST